MSLSSFLDSTAPNLVPRFRQVARDSTGTQVTTDYSFPHSYCSEVRLKSGLAPSSAVAHIPLHTSTDKTAPAIAAVPTGPLESIKIGTPAEVYDVRSTGEIQLLSGSVAFIDQDIKDDCLLVRIDCHKWLLGGVKLVGQFHISGNTIAYRQSSRCVMNPDGEPNCTSYTDGDGTEVPVFCNINYGLTAGEDPPVALTAGKASYWTPERAAVYTRWTQKSLNAASLTASYRNSTFMAGVSDLVTWPTSFSSAIESPTEVNTLRKAKEMDFEGWSIVDVLQDLCNQNGRYGLFFEANPDYKATLKILPTRYEGGGISIARSTAGNANPNMDKIVFVGGNITEDGTDLATMVSVAGAPVYIEKRLSTLESSLSWAHSATDLAAWKTYIAAASDKAEGFEQANALYPKVLAALRMDPDFDLVSGTTESEFSLADVARPPLPVLLSSFLEGTANTTYEDKQNTGRPIRFEYSEDSGSTWKMCEEQDGLTIDINDGVMYVTGLRSLGRTFISTGTTLSSKLNDASNITAVDIRVTVALPCDHRLTETVKLATDKTVNVPIVETEYDDTDRIEPGLSRLKYVDADKLYQKHVREEAFPIPATAGGTTTTDVLRDDSDSYGTGSSANNYVLAHAKRRLGIDGRIKKSAKLVSNGIRSEWRPGMIVKEMLNIASDGSTSTSYPIRAVMNEVVFLNGKQRSQTNAIMG